VMCYLNLLSSSHKPKLSRDVTEIRSNSRFLIPAVVDQLHHLVHGCGRSSNIVLQIWTKRDSFRVAYAPDYFYIKIHDLEQYQRVSCYDQ